MRRRRKVDGYNWEIHNHHNGPSIIGRFNIMRVCGEFIRMDRCMHHTTPKSRRTASDELFAVYAVRRK